MMLRILVFVCLLNFLFAAAVPDARAQAVTLTYQGSLRAGSAPASGPYDFKFDLHADESGPTPLATNIISSVQVTGGVFTVQLQFPNGLFPDASTERYLEISVKPAGGPAYETLTPRQLFTSVPYALRSRTAATALVANDAASLGGVSAGQFVQTDDARLSDARSPVAGSPEYIQNTTAEQTASNFNISGTGTAKTFNATTQFNFGGSRVLAANGSNTTLGLSAGAPDHGTYNTYAGFEAGSAATSGSSFNSFFGAQAGKANSTGLNNSFFGYQSGLANTSGGFNSFFGFASGSANTGGSRNVFLGVTAGRDNTTASDNTFVGGSAGQRNTTGELNTFVGSSAGGFNKTGSQNAFFGTEAGRANTTGGLNSFFGAFAGANNTSGLNNSFFGNQSGATNSIGGFNSFFGYASGNVNTSGNRNAFFGVTAGRDNTTGSDNIFVGGAAGQQNQTGEENTFVGSVAGSGNISGTNNAFIGRGAGNLNTAGSFNTALGAGANVTSGTLINATAIGAGATVSTNNTVVLGRTQDTVRVPGTFSAGIVKAVNGFDLGDYSFARILPSTVDPIEGSVYVGPVTGGALTGMNNAMFGFAAGAGNTGGGGNSYFGQFAGNSNQLGGNNSMFGNRAGLGSTGNENSMFGAFAGNPSNIDSGDRNSFFGAFSGRDSRGGSDNVFVGHRSGQTNRTGSGNTVIGSGADIGGSGLTNTAAIGHRAQVFSSNTMILGSVAGVNGATESIRVGIGTSIPDVNSRLHVDGNLRVANGSVFVNDPSNAGLRVQTPTAGGTVASFGGFGVFQIDAPGVQGGRLSILENGNVGLGTNTPNANSKLHVNGQVRVSNGPVYITNPNTLIITSPNGACWGITVSNTGALSTFPVNPCP